jgi:hypothetical protein
LLHLLGLTVPEGALAGLDGVLIGLRTRELLQQLLEARCRLWPVVMIVEDMHWLDSASEELLDKSWAARLNCASAPDPRSGSKELPPPERQTHNRRRHRRAQFVLRDHHVPLGVGSRLRAIRATLLSAHDKAS